MQTIIFSVIGSISLVFALLFIYYVLKNALTLKTAFSQYFLVFGSFLFVLIGIAHLVGTLVIGNADVVKSLSFVLFILGLAFILAGGFYSAIVMGRSYKLS